MYLVQERPLKTRQCVRFFYHLPPLTDLFAANHPPAWLGFILYTVGIAAAFLRGTLAARTSSGCDCRLVALCSDPARPVLSEKSPQLALRRFALSDLAASLTLLWGITFSAPNALCAMNLFLRRPQSSHCNVETRERFTRRWRGMYSSTAAAQKALVSPPVTAWRVYGASEKRSVHG